MDDGLTREEIKEMKARLIEISNILYNNLYSDAIEEGDLQNEYDYLSGMLWNIEDEETV